MKYKLAIFDLDGTILNTADDLADSLNYVLNANGHSALSKVKVISFTGNGIKRLVEQSIPKNLDEKAKQKIYLEFCDYYKTHCNVKTKPYFNMVETIKNLRKVGLITAVISNKADWAVKKLVTFHFGESFNYVYGERAGIAKKPCPDSLNELIKSLNISKENVVYVGDSEVDIQTAKNANVDCVIVDWGFRSHEYLKQRGATTIVSSVYELEKEILK